MERHTMNNSKKYKYSAADIAEMRRLYYEEKWTLSEIGELFHIKYSYAHTLINHTPLENREGLTPAPRQKKILTDQEISEIMRLAGTYPKSILAQRFGVSTRTITKTLCQHAFRG